MIPDRAAEGESAESSRRPRRRLQNVLASRLRRRRWITYALFAGSCVLLVNALVGDNGYVARLRARREHVELRKSLTTVRLENQDLREQVRRMRVDPAAVEEAARRELGLIRPGETLVIVRKGRPLSSNQR